MAHLARICTSTVFVAAIFGCLALVVAFGEKKSSWTYVPLAIYSNSSDESKFNLDLRIERISRGQYAVSGYGEITDDITDAAMVEANVYWSATSSMDYKKMSIGISNDTVINVMKSYYKNFVMESLATCSNMPQYGKEITVVMEKKRYEAKACVISTEKLPNHIQPGFYKIEFVGTGQLNWYILFTIQVETQTM